MALLGMESWDIYDTANITDYWQGYTGVITPGAGRCGSAALVNGTTSGPFIGYTPTGTGIYLGAAFNETTYGDAANIAVSPPVGGVDVGFFVRILSDGSVDLWIGPNTTLGTQVCVTAPGLQSLNTYFHLGVEGLHSATGYFKIYINGVERASYTGDTRNPYDLTPWGLIAFRPLGAVDDCYWGDLSGAAPHNAFLGDQHVEGQVVNAEGFYQDWALSTGSDSVALVSQNPPDDDTSYVYTPTPGDKETFLFPAIVPLSGPVSGIQLMPNMVKTAFATRTVRNLWRFSAADANGATQALGATSYRYYPEVAGLNPVTSSAWTVASANAVEGGVEVVA